MKSTKPTKHSPFIRALTLLLALMLAALTLSGCRPNAAVGAQTNTTDEPSAEPTEKPTALPEFIKQISTADDNNEASGKGRSSFAEMDVSCLSFYLNGSKIIVDAAMGDEYSHAQDEGYFPRFDSFDEENYPIFNVTNHTGYDTTPFEMREPSKMLINGSLGVYEKRFCREEMEELDILWLDIGTDRARLQDPSEWHHEIVEIDFSALERGNFGSINFSFGWQGNEETLKENPYCHIDDNPYRLGYGKTLWYYVGEKGIVLSRAGWETAKKECYMIEPRYIKPATSEFRDSNGSCAAKPLYVVGAIAENI